MLKVKSRTFTMYFGIAIFIVCVSFSALFYVTRLNDILRKENNIYVEEVNEAISTRINLIVNSHIDSLEVLAAQIDVDALKDSESIVAYMKNTESVMNSKSLGIVNAQGIMHAESGYIGDVSLEPYFEEGMRKKNSLSMLDIKNSTSTFLIGVPIKDMNGNSIGILMETVEKEEFYKLLTTKHFENTGQVSLVDSNGKVIIQEQGKKTIFNNNNFFDSLESSHSVNDTKLKNIEASFSSDTKGNVDYKLDNISYYSSYMPLEFNNWKIIVTFPLSAMQNAGKNFIYSTAFMGIALIISFVSLVIYILHIQKKHNAKLEKIAFVDGITGYDNWNAYKYKVKENFKMNAHKKFAIIYFDVCRFKIINDMYGYTAGDLTLKYISKVIDDSLNEGEYFTRLFADKFNIIFEYESDDIIVERFTKIVKDINSFQALSDSFEIVICAGIYRINDLNMSISLMSDRANIAKREIKNSHVTDFKFYQEDIRNKMIQENEIESHMQDALKNDEFIIFLQPKYDVNTLAIGGAEALVRWKSYNGLLLPDDFIPLFEENGFIVEMDKYVFVNVCKMIRGWIDKGIEPIVISVNLSKVHFRNLSFLDEYQSIIDRYGVPAKYIELEITESVAVENMDILINVISRIKEIGFTCSLDDFGSGYSSLNILKEVPVDVIKLDKVFFKESVNSRRRNKIICSIVALAKELNMKTVSEGIETKKQLELLKSVGCDMVQGYIFSRPISVEEFEDIMLQGPIHKGKIM